jgi:hypothetical protein
VFFFVPPSPPGSRHLQYDQLQDWVNVTAGDYADVFAGCKFIRNENGTNVALESSRTASFYPVRRFYPYSIKGVLCLDLASEMLHKNGLAEMESSRTEVVSYSRTQVSVLSATGGRLRVPRSQFFAPVTDRDTGVLLGALSFFVNLTTIAGRRFGSDTILAGYDLNSGSLLYSTFASESPMIDKPSQNVNASAPGKRDFGLLSLVFILLSSSLASRVPRRVLQTRSILL